MAEEPRRDTESLCWWLPKGKATESGPPIDDNERARRAVKAQKLIANLSIEGYRRERDLFNVRMYENNPLVTLYAFAGKYYTDTTTLAMPPAEQSVDNKAKSAIDTLASQVFSTEVRARFLSRDAKEKQRRRAREMQNFSDGLANELELQELMARAGLDSCILESGVGAIQFYEEEGRCKAQRVLGTELCFDLMDGLVDGQPRTLYRARPMPRDYVRETFGDTEEKRKAIEEVNAVATGGTPSDHIMVYESWHLRTTKKSGDGWHVVALDHETGALEVKPYERRRHEIVFISLEGRFTTGWGLSLMSQMRPLQIRINANRYRVERAQKLFHAGHLYVNRLAKIDKSKLSNEIGSVWEGNGDTPPQQILFQAAAKEMYDQIDADGRLIFENHGISVAASQGETNAGLNASAASKREDTAKSDKRNSRRQQRWERFKLDCIRAALDVVREIVGSKGKSGGYEVATPGKSGLTVQDWREVGMDEDDYVLTVKAASPIPTEPAGLVAFGDRMLEIGEWQPGELTAYLQELDADGRVNRRASMERQLEKTYEALLYDKVAAAQPDEFTDYAMAIELGTEYLAQGQEDEVPDKNLDRVRRYIKKCKALMKAAQAAMQPPAPPPGPAGPPDQGAAPMPQAA